MGKVDGLIGSSAVGEARTKQVAELRWVCKALCVESL